MINAKTELEQFIAETGLRMIAADITLKVESLDNLPVRCFLPQLHNDQDLERFMNALDFEYEGNYASDIQLNGFIWLDGGAWGCRERWESMGSWGEWWELYQRPEIPSSDLATQKRLNEICLKFNSGIFPTQEEWAFCLGIWGEDEDKNPELTAKIDEFWATHTEYRDRQTVTSLENFRCSTRPE